MWTPERIFGLRKRYRETQEVFAGRVGVDPWTLRKWEQGKRNPSGSAELLMDRLEEDLTSGKIRDLPPAIAGEAVPA